MARRAKRRGFGKVEAKMDRHGELFYQTSYPTPLEAFSRLSGLSQRQYQNFSTMTEAEAWLAGEKRLIDQGIWAPPQERKAQEQRKRVSFRDYATDWVENHRKNDGQERQGSTKRNQRALLKNHLLPVFGNRALADIHPKDVEDWYGTYPSDSQAGYNALTLLKTILNSAATEPIDDQGTTLIDKSPVMIRRSRPKKVHQTVNASLEQIKALSERMPDRLALSVWFMGVLYMRVGEVLALRRCDVDLKTNVIHVSGSIKPIDTEDGHYAVARGGAKDDSERDVPIPPSFVPMIEEHLREHVAKSRNAFLFTNARSDRHMYENTFNYYFRQARAGVPGLENYWCHDGRHSSYARFAESGASEAMQMALAGHKDIRMVSTYLDTSSEQHKREVMAKMDRQLAPVLSGETKPAESATSASAGGSDSGNGDAEVMALAGVLEAMALDVRVDVLRGLEEGKRTRVLACFSQPVQVETMIRLFSEVA